MSEQPHDDGAHVHFLNADTAWEPWLAGQVQYLRRPGENDRGFETGIWQGTPSDLPPGTVVRSRRRETILILTGRVRLETEDGRVVELGPGDGASIDPGQAVTWTILTDVFEEFFVYDRPAHSKS